MLRRVAVEYLLTDQGQPVDARAIVAHVRTLTVADLDPLGDLASARDSHGNTIVPATGTGVPQATGPAAPEQDLYALLSLLVHGGGFPGFEDVYTFAGFMFPNPGTAASTSTSPTPGRCTGYGSHWPTTPDSAACPRNSPP